MSAAPRHTLVVAYAYPPCGGAGVQRVASFVKTLAADRAWHTTVLTVDPSCYGVLDMSHDPQPAGTDVVRTRCPDPVADAKRPIPAPGVAAADPSPRANPLRRELRRVAGTVWRWIDRYLLIPDQFVAWMPFATSAARRIHARRSIDVVFATGEPYSTFLIGARIARSCGARLVLDMRDPWTLLSYRDVRWPAWRQRFESWLERRALTACDACIFANRAMDAYADRYPHLAHKFHYVPNGYNPRDLEGVTPRTFDRHTIVHSGTFLPGYRTADTFLAALRQVVDADPRLRERMSILFVGKPGPERPVVERLGLGDIVQSTGYVSHADSLGYVMGADQLLLVGGPHRWEETGKVFEYLAARRPILALVEPEGTAGALLRNVPHATVVDRRDVAGVTAALNRALAAGRVTTPAPPPPWLSDYNREHLSRRMAEVLGRV